MRKSVICTLVGVVASTLLVGGSPAGAAPPPAEQGPAAAPTRKADIRDRVAALPGVVSVNEQFAPRGYRFFVIRFTQPVDHDDPSLGTFKQRLTLLHKNTSRPMVMYTGGYNVATYASRSEPAQIVDGNQLSMEYRFFQPSRPADPDWQRELTIRQAAADQHRVIRQFKRIYRANWLTTGGSKGGMTATYHRRFYPDDVSGTIPYVAPNDVVDDDDVYNAFLDQVGTSQQCRDDLTALQERVLTGRRWYLHRVREESAANGLTYDLAGSLGLAVESSVVDMYFVFWQYSTQRACRSLPDPVTASNNQVYNFYAGTSPLTGYSDQALRRYVPYYFQAAYQLGSPEPYETRIGADLRYPGSDVAATFVPDALLPTDFDDAAMPDIDQWVSTESTQMLYIYGRNDPWGAEPFTCGVQAEQRECSRYFVAGGNHGSRIAELPPAKRAKARALVLQWAGLGPADPAAKVLAKTGSPRRVPALDTVPDYARPPLP